MGFNFGLLGQLFSGDLSVFTFIVIVLTVIMAVTVHEFAHAYVADRFGDSTPRRYGRVTLNPVAHISPISLVFILIFGLIFGSTPVNPNALGRWGGFWVAAAGPLSNFLVAAIALILLYFFKDVQILSQIFQIIIQFNILLAIFNLFPIPLLDGSRILAGLFPNYLGRTLKEFEAQPYSNLLVFAFIIFFGGQLVAFASGIAQNLINLVN